MERGVSPGRVREPQATAQRDRTEGGRRGVVSKGAAGEGEVSLDCGSPDPRPGASSPCPGWDSGQSSRGARAQEEGKEATRYTDCVLNTRSFPSHDPQT